MHSLPFRQKFRRLTVMAAPAANEAQPQGPQVPRVRQANVVHHILAERPPQKPILDTNGLEVMCLPFFHTSLALLPLFMSTCRHVLICPFPAFTCVVFVLHSIQLAFFLWPLFVCFLVAFSKFYPIANAFVISNVSFQFFAFRPCIVLFSSISSFPTFFCRLSFYFVVSSLFILSFLSLLRFAKYFVLALPHLHLLICFSPPGLSYSLPCYELFVPYAFHFSFSGTRSSFVCLFVSS